MHNFHEEPVSDFTPLAQKFNDRRKDSPMPVLLALVTKVHESQKELDRKLTRHMTDETDELAKAITQLMKEAFPDGDPLGHRADHEVRIEKEKEKVAFWKEMRLAAAKWAGLGLLGFLVAAAWTQFLKGPHA
ncbi:hypothetical protein UFOVP228_89 [uncultured Caudovirales phage]|uniref:Transmembrane protein n=1 Tax=uncultured Caudovirales phage TaxID=2100421 RepID=A0A6J5T7J7_9CAUD|nr:hypothetical protein UFOVP47_13 [uncultured Caudovirales phage]CAB5219567.1 hypothetical protein UFOVP228_89 [uncultured Caudovirales phage]